jgi:hypothetical protein
MRRPGFRLGRNLRLVGRLIDDRLRSRLGPWKES